MKRIEFITDPSTNKLSASRLCLMVEVLLFIPAFILLCALGLIPEKAVAAIGSCLGAVVAATCGVYGVSTYTSGAPGVGAFLQTTLSVPPPIPGIERAKPSV